MNLSNPGLPDRKAVNRAVAAKSAIATKSMIVTNKAVAARSTSAINKAVAAKSPVAKKAADNKLRKEPARALGNYAFGLMSGGRQLPPFSCR
jgi:hypothetical protein